MKTHINITVDLDAYLDVKRRKINVSKLLSDFLVDYVGIKKLDIKGKDNLEKIKNLEIQEKILRIEREKLVIKQNKVIQEENKRAKKWINPNLYR